MQVGSVHTGNNDPDTIDREISLEEAYRHCRDLTRKNAKNFYLAFFFVSWIKRRSIYAVYSFCRYSDDLVDDPVIRDRSGMLNKWREDLEACYRGEVLGHPIMIALQDTIRRFSIPRQYFLDLIDGMEMDLSITRYQTFEQLYQYAYKAASVVGLILIEIFGYRNSGTREYAKNLGIAMQLTNIIRDVQEDANRGRIYLPQEDLKRFKLTEAELLKSSYQPSFIQLMEYQAARALYYYQKATSLIPPEDRNLLTSAEVMKNIYFHLLREIRQQGFNVFRRRIESSKLTKLFIVLRTWFRIQIWRQ
jgi:phytoene synthase